MGTVRRVSSGWWFFMAIGPLILVHPLLSTDVRDITFVLSCAATLLPLGRMVYQQERWSRPSGWTLIAASVLLTGGNSLTAFGGAGVQGIAQIVMTVGHAVLVAAAVMMLMRRGRNDLGGMLDVSVGVMGIGGTVWTVLIFPRLLGMGAERGEQVGLLVGILAIGAVLGALYRVQMVTSRELPAVRLLMAALATALIGDVGLAVTTGAMTTGRPAGLEMLIMSAYLFLGVGALHPSMHELARSGPTPQDRLSMGRLAFLGVALALNPVAGGVRAIAGLPVDGPLLAVGTLFVVPLVMVRVGRLARQREQAELALVHQATHDVLTGLPNRGELITRLDAALHRERLAGTSSVVLLFCDLNGFKEVNDRLGHLAGDELLVKVAARIRGGLRAGDTLARYGGDEFLVLCEETAQEQAVCRLMSLITGCLHAPFDLIGEQVRISCSIGAVMSDGDTAGDDLILRADQAMYRAKQGDRQAVGR